MTYPGVIFWILLLLGVVSDGPGLLYLLIGTTAIGTLSVVPPALTGGTTIQPESVCAVAFFVKLLCRPGAVTWMIDAALRFDKLLMLTVFLLICIVCTIFGPLLFQGIAIMPLRAAGAQLAPMPLQISSSNITQLGYITLSVATVFAFAFAVQAPGFLERVLNAFLICGALFVATGIADMLAQRFGAESLLVPFRNATYSLLIDNVLDGYQRVIGLMSEASAYGPGCITMLAILTMLRPYYRAGFQHRLCVALMFGLLLLGYLSTSTTAYAGIVVFFVAYGLDWCHRALYRGTRGRATLSLEFILVGGVVFSLACLVAFDDTVLRDTISLIDLTVFDKTATSSYIVRSYWNSVSWRDLFASYGFGVGVGSTRASDWVIAVLSNTGVLGGLALGILLLQTFLRRTGRDRFRAGIATALKVALIVPLATETVSSPVPDFGPVIAIMIGLIVGISLISPARQMAPEADETNERPASWQTLPAAHTGMAGGVRP